eukprot:11304818-Karenia_brevis.AAC.1
MCIRDRPRDLTSRIDSALETARDQRPGRDQRSVSRTRVRAGGGQRLDPRDIMGITRANLAEFAE